MSWATFPDRHVAEQVCTQAELDVLTLKASGYGRRRGSLTLGISEETWRYRMRRALMKIEQAKKVAA